MRPAKRRTDGAADRVLARTAGKGAGWGVLLGTASLACAVAETLVPAALGRAVDAILGSPGHPSADGPVTACAVLIACVVVCDAFAEWATGASTARATGWLRHVLIGHLLAVGPRLNGRFTPGDLVSRIVAGAADAGKAPPAAATTAASVVPIAGGLVALTLIDPWLTVAFAAGVPAIVALLSSFMRRTSDVSTAYLDVQGRIAGRLVGALGGIRTIAASGTGDREARRVLAELPALRGHGMEVWRIHARAQAGAVLLVPLIQVVVLAVAGYGLAAGRITPGEMLAASQYVLLAVGVGPVTGGLNQLARARAGARRAHGLLAERPAGYGTADLPPGPGTIEFREVTVRRPGGGSTRPGPDGGMSSSGVILDGLDLFVPGGAVVAVVGRSGAGKSYLAALCGRLADPDSGEVLLDGVPLRSLGRTTLRREVGYAFERPALLGETVADAIAFGPGGSPAEEAARSARADEFIRLLPAGYHTPLSEAPMSGGEVQRVGLARAFARAGRVLVLDDATSSLDTVTEAQVTEALTTRFAGRTRLIIAHRVATAARADLVVWLDDGRVRGRAPHSELWRDPAYRAVFQATHGVPASGGSPPGPAPDRGTPASASAPAGDPRPDLHSGGGPQPWPALRRGAPAPPSALAGDPSLRRSGAAGEVQAP